MEIIKLNRWSTGKFTLDLRSGDTTIIQDRGPISKIANIRIKDVNQYLEKIIYSRSSDDEAIRTIRSIFGRRYWRIEIQKNNSSLIDRIEINYAEPDKCAVFSFYISSKLFLLINNYTFKRYRKHFELALAEFTFNQNIAVKSKDIVIKDFSEGMGFWINISSANKALSIFDLIFFISQDLKNIHDFIENKLVNKNRRGIIETYFAFPIEIKFYCEQYLLYFAQFLKDLGINTTSNLKEEAGKVLFSITPTDNIEALDKIREALAVYLNLPASPIVYDESFAAMRWKQQIDLLKHSQQMAETEFRLKMAQGLAEAQNKTIEDQSEIIVQQSSFIQQQKEHIEKIKNPSVMMDSAQNKEELEEIYDGLKIGESKFLKEQLGIYLNPAKIIKTAVKNTFGKEDKGKSILGLDEETSIDD